MPFAGQNHLFDAKTNFSVFSIVNVKNAKNNKKYMSLIGCPYKATKISTFTERLKPQKQDFIYFSQFSDTTFLDETMTRML